MMEKSILTILLFAFVFSIHAQQTAYNDSSEIENYALQFFTGEKYNDPGSKHLNIYFRENWLPGRIILGSGHVIKNATLKFNGANNYLIVRNDRIGQIKTDNQSISDFYLIENKKEYHFKKLKIDTVSQNELFYQFVFKLKFEMYVYRRVTSVATYNTPEGTRRLYRPKPIYILFVNNKYILFDQPTQKAVYRRFPDIKNKIKQSNPESLKKIKTEEEFFKFINQIEDMIIESIQ